MQSLTFYYIIQIYFYSNLLILKKSQNKFKLLNKYWQFKNNILKLRRWIYIEIFTIKEYDLYQQKYGKIYLNDVEEEYNLLKINNVHDKICRKALDKKKDAVKIINRILQENDKILESQIEKYNSSYISNELKNSESDIVYKLKKQNVFFLIEHQTKIDYLMPYRILKYELNIIDSVLVDVKHINKNYNYPQIIPIVLYTGKEKWNVKTDLRSVQYKWNKYKEQELSRYNILDINKISDEELLDEESIISKILLIEKSRTEQKLCENLNKIYNKINKNKEKYTKEEMVFLKKITEVLTLNIVGKEKARRILGNLDIGGEKNMLAVFDMIEETNKRMIKKGRKQEKIEIIKNMLKEKFSIETISKITGMTKEEIEKYTKQ